MQLRRRALTEIDRAEWANYARRIAPLRGRALDATAPAPLIPELPSATIRVPLAVLQTRHARIQSSVTIGGQPGGIDTSTWQRFRGGKLPAARRLDLHGQTTQRAYFALMAFLRTAHADHVRCVEVITGRGSGEHGGAIKREFPLWLNLPEIRPIVLAAAHPHAANPGSVRLLLRRIR
jgi:DNA-nicking Smr family endonuclease